MNTRKRSGNMIVVLAIFFMLISNGAVTASLQSLMEVFPDEPVSSIYLILSLPTVFTMIFSFVSGWLATKNVPFKKLAVIGLILLTAAGIFPVFLNSVNSILLTRAFFGIGVGLINPMGNTLSILYYGPEKGGKVIGYGNASMNLGCSVGQMLGGILCGINWRFTFLAYLVGVIPLVIVALFMEEPEVNPTMNRAENVNSSNSKIPYSVYFLGFILFLGQLLLYPLYLNLSSILQVSIPGGTPAIAGTALSMMNIAGIVVGVFFGQLFKIFKRFIHVVGFLLGAVGLYLVSSTGSIAGIITACILCGLNSTLLVSGILNEVALAVDRSLMPKASGIAMAFFSLAPLVGTVYASLMNKIPNIDPMRYIFFVGAIGEIILASVWIASNLKKK